MTTLELLKAGKEVIQDPNKWSRGSMARKGDGTPTYESDPDATRWCSIGILYKLMPKLGPKYEEADHLLREASGSAEYFGFWQDSHTHAEVMAVWDRAIQLAEQAEQTGQQKP